MVMSAFTSVEDTERVASSVAAFNLTIGSYSPRAAMSCSLVKLAQSEANSPAQRALLTFWGLSAFAGSKPLPVI